MKAITKMLEEWMKNKHISAGNLAPSARERSILLVKLTQYVEKRFPDETELNAQFLELVAFVYMDDALKASELATKLEQAFLAGLRCTQPHIRAKFFKVSKLRLFSPASVYVQHFVDIGCLDETPPIRSVALYFMLSKLGTNRATLLDQTNHRTITGEFMRKTF